jgi:SNF2 family DNA or RNA helicase
MDKPFDIYPQVRFLDADWWVRTCAIGSFTAFKAHFAEWVQVMTSGGRSFPSLKGYRNLDELSRSIAPISSRVMKDDVLDLPPKVYKRVFVELSPPQRAAYDALRNEAMALLDSGELVTAEMALVLQLRLTQICSGFITPAAGLAPVPFATNPKGEMLVEILRDLTRPAIIWARFVHDVESCRRASVAAGRRPVVFDGQRSDDAINAFHCGEADDIVANIESNMREGYTLTEADTVVYYSNSPKLLNRLQSEDRAHRIGQTRSVTYIDLLAERTLEKKTLADLQAKRSSTGTVLGDDPDRVRAWLREALEE